MIIDRLATRRSYGVVPARGRDRSIVEQRLAEAGATLVLVDNDANRLDRARGAQRSVGSLGNALDEVADVADIDEVRALVARAVARFGRIDVRCAW